MSYPNAAVLRGDGKVAAAVQVVQVQVVDLRRAVVQRPQRLKLAAGSPGDGKVLPLDDTPGKVPEDDQAVVAGGDEAGEVGGDAHHRHSLVVPLEDVQEVAAGDLD